MHTPATQCTILLCCLRQWMCTAAHITLKASRVTDYQTMSSDIFCHHCPCANQSKGANHHTADNHRSGTNRSTIVYQCWHYGPISSIFQRSLRSYCTWIQIIGKTDMRTNADPIVKCDTSKE